MRSIILSLFLFSPVFGQGPFDPGYELNRIARSLQSMETDRLLQEYRPNPETEQYKTLATNLYQQLQNTMQIGQQLMQQNQQLQQKVTFLNTRVTKLSRDLESAGRDSKSASDFTRETVKAIDDAIKASDGKLLSDYLNSLFKTKPTEKLAPKFTVKLEWVENPDYKK